MAASQLWIPALYALLLWWVGTGVVLYLDRLPRRTYPVSMGVATVLLFAAFWGIALSAGEAGVAGAYVAFTSAILVWGWHELSYYTGYVTGPRMEACPEGARGWRRFGRAVQTCLYHELGILVSASLILAVTWQAPNRTGLWTFVVLWVMRISAKLNIYLGVRNLSEEWLPEPLRFLDTYVARRPMNFLFPVSVTVATLVLALMGQRAIAGGLSDAAATGLALVATLLALAILEHWFLMLPVSVDALWKWGFRPRREEAPVDTDGIAPVLDPVMNTARPAAAGSMVLVGDADDADPVPGSPVRHR